MAQSTNMRFEQHYLINTARSQACMLGIQEMASKLDVTISSLEELLAKATASTARDFSSITDNQSHPMKSIHQQTKPPVPKSIDPSTSLMLMTQASTLTYSTMNQQSQEMQHSQELLEHLLK